MQRTVLAMLVAGGFGLFGALPASAAPADGAAVAKLGHQSGRIIQVLGNCGRGWHRSRWGHCIPGCGPGWYQPYPGAHCQVHVA